MFPEVFPIGTKYKPVGKDYICTVEDIFTTTNLAGDVVKIEYKSSYHFMHDQTRLDVKTTIARGLISTP